MRIFLSASFLIFSKRQKVKKLDGVYFTNFIIYVLSFPVNIIKKMFAF